MKYIPISVLPTLFFIAMSSPFLCFSQTTRVSGRVIDAVTSEPLQFANIWVEGSVKGTTSDRNGKFTLHLTPGQYPVIVSYLGYKSVRKDLTVSTAPLELEFSLSEINIEMPEVMITPGDNPALRIIRLAIENKKKQKEKLENYSVSSHSKLVVTVFDAPGIRSSVQAGNDGERASITIGSGASSTDTSSARSDSSAGPLKAILETQTDAYWAKPDRYKEIIKARKQTSFIPAQSNIMISSFFIIDFSSDELKLSDKSAIVGPISDAGLRNYYYKLTGTTAMDGKKIFMIDISALNENDPLLEGTIYIAEGSYALMMVDVRLNKAALPTFFSNLEFKQHFRLLDDQYWMPVDVVVDAKIAVSMIITLKLDIEGFSVLQDYAINSQQNENFFDRTRIKVLNEADERDSIYWKENQKIPNTDEELHAYKIADSVKVALDSVRNDYSWSNLLTGKTFSSDINNYDVPGFLSLYRFNRVEGHALYPSFSIRNRRGLVNRFEVDGGYGFSDKRWKYDLAVGIRFLQSPRISLSARLFDNAVNIDEGSDQWGSFTTTLSNLLTKYDYKDYYYLKGWRISTYVDLLFLFPTTLFVESESDLNAQNNTDWSIFRRDWPSRANPAINEGKLTSFGITIGFDNRPFIDDAGEIRRFGSRNHTPSITLSHHSTNLANESFTYSTISASLRGTFDFGRFGSTSYRISGDIATGKLVTQRLFILPGTVNYVAGSSRFRTLAFREFGGDHRAIISLDHDFGDQLFRWLHFPFLESSGWGLVTFVSAGWTSMSASSSVLQTVVTSEANSPFFEAGLSIDKIFLLFRLDLAWRLNHFRDGRNYFIGISTPFTM